MIKKCAAILCLLMVLVFINSYAADESYVVKPKYEIEKIVSMAKEFAAGKRVLEKYFINYVKYEPAEKKWIVYFQGYILAPGNHFLVFLKETTGEMELMLGK